MITVSFRGSTSDEATQDVINTQIPAIADLCLSGELHVDNIDVFCEKGVFNTDQTREILQTGKQAGWNINFHGDELHSMNSGEVCVHVIKTQQLCMHKAYLIFSINQQQRPHCIAFSLF